MTKSQSGGEREGVPHQGRCRCKDKKLRERATCDSGGSSSSRLCVVVKEGTGEGHPCGHRGTQAHWGKLRTEGAAGVYMQVPGKKHWV